MISLVVSNALAVSRLKNAHDLRRAVGIDVIPPDANVPPHVQRGATALVRADQDGEPVGRRHPQAVACRLNTGNGTAVLVMTAPFGVPADHLTDGIDVGVGLHGDCRRHARDGRQDNRQDRV